MRQFALSCCAAMILAIGACTPLEGGWDGMAAFESEDSIAILGDGGNYGRVMAPFASEPEVAFEALPFRFGIHDLWVQPGADRAVMRVSVYHREKRARGRVVLTADPPVALDVSPSGRTLLLDTQNGQFLDAFLAEGTAPHALLFVPGIGVQLQAGGAPGASWAAVSTENVGLLQEDSALVVEANGTPVASSYGRIIVSSAKDGFVVVHGTSVGYPIISDGDRATSGDAVFFGATLTTASGWSVDRAMRNESGWEREAIANVPGERSSFVFANVAIDAVNESCFAIITHRCNADGSCPATLYAGMNDGTGWVVEQVAALENDPKSFFQNDGERGLSAVSCPPKIITGTVNLMLHERGPGGVWSSRRIARLGSTETGSAQGCSVSGARRRIRRPR